MQPDNRMKPFRAIALLLPLLAAAAPARAQQAEAWVLPRGMLELSAGGAYTHHDRVLGWGGAGLGVELLPAYQAAADRALAPALGEARAGVATVLASLPGGDTGPEVAETLTGGRAALGLAADLRQAPLAVRYGLTRRVTLFATLTVERRETAVTGLYLAGGNLGINPAPDSNRAVLERVNPAFADAGATLLLPVAGTPAAAALQARLEAASPGDTLRLPAFPVRVADLLAVEALGAALGAEEREALALPFFRRPYGIGDLRLGARVLLLRGPGGWGWAEEGGRGVRAVAGAHARIPTGRAGVTFLSEIPADGGHAGVGGELRSDVFLSSRWMVHAGASVEHAFPTDVPSLAFGAERPFPADTALRTVRRQPGLRLEALLSPRWRLTEEITVEGSYALAARARTEYTGADGETAAAPPLEWRTGGSAHALGLGLRYSTLTAYRANPEVWPYEVSLAFSTAVAGAGHAPRATSVRVTGRLFLDRRRLTAVLPGRDAPPAADFPAEPPPSP